ncbi:MAG: tetratricopeptide repeat-containing sensor histidine kinase [Bacteroidales bacterium]
MAFSSYRAAIGLLLLWWILAPSSLVHGNHQTDSLELLLEQHLFQDSLRVNLLNQAARAWADQDQEKALVFSQEAVALAREIGYPRGEGEGLRLIGWYYENTSDYVRALECYDEALTILQDLGDLNGISDAYNDLGKIYAAQGDYASAFEYYQSSLKIVEQLNDSSGISTVCNNLGNIYLFLGEYVQASAFYERSMRLDSATNDLPGVSATLNNLGIVAEYQGQHEQALAYYLKSMEMDRTLQNIRGIATSSNNVATIYRYLKEYPLALKYYREALAISDSIGKKSTQTYSYVGLAAYYRDLKDPHQAYAYGRKAYSMAREIGNAELVRESAEILSETCAILGDFEEAYTYQVVFKTYSDSLLNKGNLLKISALESKFAFDKEREAVALEKQQLEALHAEEAKRHKVFRLALLYGVLTLFLIVMLMWRINYLKKKSHRILQERKEKVEDQAMELAVRNRQLKILDDTKNKFFAIIAHDLKSPFSSLLALSELMNTSFKEFPEEKKLEFIQSMSEQIKRMYALLENLLSWANAQTGKMKNAPERLLLKDIFRNVVQLAESNALRKDIVILGEVSGDLEVFADRKMTETILRNLLSNAIKFTPRGGKVQLEASLSDSGDFVEISVVDTGMGIPEEERDKLFRLDQNVSTKGTDQESGTGLGLILCKEFVEQCRGEIWIDSQYREGCRFVFTLPVNEGG